MRERETETSKGGWQGSDAENRTGRWRPTRGARQIVWIPGKANGYGPGVGRTRKEI